MNLSRMGFGGKTGTGTLFTVFTAPYLRASADVVCLAPLRLFVACIP